MFRAAGDRGNRFFDSANVCFGGTSEETVGWPEADIASCPESGFTPDLDSVGGPMVDVRVNISKRSAHPGSPAWWMKHDCAFRDGLGGAISTVEAIDARGRAQMGP